MGAVSLWTCTVFLLCLSEVARSQHFYHENASRGFKPFSSKLNFKNLFGSKLVQKLSDNYGNAQSQGSFGSFEQSMPVPVSSSQQQSGGFGSSPPPPPPPPPSYPRGMYPYEYHNPRMTPPLPTASLAREYQNPPDNMYGEQMSSGGHCQSCEEQNNDYYGGEDDHYDRRTTCHECNRYSGGEEESQCPCACESCGGQDYMGKGYSDKQDYADEDCPYCQSEGSCPCECGGGRDYGYPEPGPPPRNPPPMHRYPPMNQMGPGNMEYSGPTVQSVQTLQPHTEIYPLPPSYPEPMMSQNQLPPHRQQSGGCGQEYMPMPQGEDRSCQFGGVQEMQPVMMRPKCGMPMDMPVSHLPPPMAPRILQAQPMPGRMPCSETFHAHPMQGFTEMSAPVSTMQTIRLGSRIPPPRFLQDDAIFPVSSLPPPPRGVYQELPDHRPRKYTTMENRGKPEFFDNLSFSDGC